MTTQTQISRPAPFIEDIGKDFAKSLIGVTGLPALATDISGQLTKRTIQDPEDASKFRLETDEELANRQQIARERFQTFEQTKAGQAPFAPEVAPQDDLQLEAAKLATQDENTAIYFIKDSYMATLAESNKRSPLLTFEYTDENGATYSLDTDETDKTWENESTRDTTPMVQLSLKEYDALKDQTKYITDPTLISAIDKIEFFVKELRKHIVRKY